MFSGFSFRRFFALLIKELIQMKRDKATFSMLLSVPLMELLLFGYEINADPKHLPTVVVDADQSVMSRSLVSALEISDYFQIIDRHASEESGGSRPDRTEDHRFRPCGLRPDKTEVCGRGESAL